MQRYIGYAYKQNLKDMYVQVAANYTTSQGATLLAVTENVVMNGTKYIV